MRKLMMVCSALVMVAGAATAGELPKEGKVSGTYYGSGTYQFTGLGKGGKDGGISAYSASGYTVGSQLIDHVTWHCVGAARVINNNITARGSCVGTDPSGDQIMEDVENTAETPLDAGERPGRLIIIGGTGKYAGITGSYDMIEHVGGFKEPAERTFVETADLLNGSYKLP